MTLAERVLELLRVSPALDDDELARRLDVNPRQAVNQACRKLEDAGRLRRRHGRDGKLVNELPRGDLDPSGGTSTSHPDATAPAGAELPAGDSGEQRRAERLMLDELTRELGVALHPRRLVIRDGVRVKLDGADAALTVLVEAWAHQGPAKPAQRNKVLADALKLTWVASTLPTRPRLVLCLSDPQAATPFLAKRSWPAAALADLGVEVRGVELPQEVRELIVAAQRRQYR